MNSEQLRRATRWLVWLTCFSPGCSEDTDCALTATCELATTVSPNLGLPGTDAGEHGEPRGPSERDASVTTPSATADESLNPIFILSVCGNGEAEPGEGCDDSNDVDGDGCSACEVDPGGACVAGSKQCTTAGLEETCTPEGVWAAAVACVDCDQACAGGCLENGCEFLCKETACGGSCLPDTSRCEPGESNAVQTCGAEGQWKPSVECEAGRFCMAGTCKPCEPGSKRCGEAGPEQCNHGGEWEPQGACDGESPVCFDGTCVACLPDARRCAGSRLEQCSADGLEWTLKEACGGGTPACLASTLKCGRCQAGAAQCSEDTVQSCSNTGEWVDLKACTGATPQCAGGVCHACDPEAAERRCASSTSVEECGADGKWKSAGSCPGDRPLCRADIGATCGCQEGAERCTDATSPERCVGGAWVKQNQCSGATPHCLATAGACVSCVPSAEQCQNGVAQRCQANGTWSSLNSCAGTTVNCGGCSIGQSCEKNSDCVSGACVGLKCAECSPGAKECTGSVPRVCSSDGAWVNQPACSGSTSRCLAGSCVCATNQTRCDDSSTRAACMSSGQWESTKCTGDTPRCRGDGVCGCLEGASRCAGSNEDRCVSGVWQPLTCSLGCVANECRLDTVATAGKFACDTNAGLNCSKGQTCYAGYVEATQSTEYSCSPLTGSYVVSSKMECDGPGDCGAGQVCCHIAYSLCDVECVAEAECQGTGTYCREEALRVVCDPLATEPCPNNLTCKKEPWIDSGTDSSRRLFTCQ